MVNYFVLRSSLAHCQEMDSIHKDLPLHCSIAWWSGGNVLERFIEYFDVLSD